MSMKKAREMAVVKVEPPQRSNSRQESALRRGLRRTVQPQQRYSASPEVQPPKRRSNQRSSSSTANSSGRRSTPKSYSKVWLFCEKFVNEKGEPKARCKFCSTVLCHNGGSTRGILHHLRNRHSHETGNLIQPAAVREKKPLPGATIDIEDDDAWIQEVDDDDDDDEVLNEEAYSEKGKESSVTQDSEEKKAKSDEGDVRYAPIPSDEAPSFAGEVFIHEDGSYVNEDGDEFVDVVYVQDEGDMGEEIVKNDEEGGFNASSLMSPDRRRGIETSPSHIALPNASESIVSSRTQRKRFWRGSRSSNANDNNSAHYEMDEYGAPEVAGTSHVTDGFVIRDHKTMFTQSKISRSESKVLDVDEHFGVVVTLSLRAMPLEQRARARAAILQCIAQINEEDPEEPESFRNE